MLDVNKTVLGAMLQAPLQVEAYAEQAKALQADPAFLEPYDAPDVYVHLPLWHAICSFKGVNPAHPKLTNPDYAETMQRHTTGDVSNLLKELVRLHGKALGHAKAGSLKGFGDTSTDFKTTVHELTAWAEKVGEGTSEVARQTTTETPENELDIKPIQRGKAQDYVILKTLRSMGYNPLRLPKNPNGKDGVKAEVRGALKDNKLFTGTTVFRRAWERLTANGDIVIAKVSP
jgi:hypothetical protein